MRSERLAWRLAALLLIIVTIGLPISDLADYGLLVAAVVVIFTGSIATAPRRWLAAAAVGAAVIAIHAWWPAPRIEEGHNAFLPGPMMAQTSGLPADVLQAMSRQFDEEYPPDKRCSETARGCWRPDRSGDADGFAFSADAVFYRPAYSRRVAGIGFSDPAYLRLGFINDYRYNWPDDWSDIKRFERDRRSLNLFDRYHVTFPLFVMYRLPADFAGSRLCWRGTLMWEAGDAHFATMTAADRQCRVIAPADAGKRIFALSIKRDLPLAVTLEANPAIALHHAVETGLPIAAAIGIVVLLVRIDRRRLVVPAVLIGLSLLTTLFADATLIGGFRPLDSGDDGIIYEGYGRDIVRHLLSGNLIEAVKGVEPVYYFTPGMRYVRALELFAFGDTFLLYLSAMLALPVLVLALFRRFLPPRWTLVLVIEFTATPIGALFGSSLFQYVVWASRGFADPFAFVLLLAAMVLMVPQRPQGEAPGRRRIFAAGLLFSAAAFCRPNLILTAGAMVAGAMIIFVARRQWSRAAAAAAGFATLVLSPLHNYVFGHAFVLFSDNVNQPRTLLMSPLDYVRAAYEVITLDFAGPHVESALAQLGRWLSGPQQLAAMLPVHALAVATLIRVGVFGSRFDPWLRVVALATLLQHAIGASYVNYARYNLGTWLLTMMVAAVWIDREGLELLRRALPGWYEAWQCSLARRRLDMMVGSLARRFGLGEVEPRLQPAGL